MTRFVPGLLQSTRQLVVEIALDGSTLTDGYRKTIFPEKTYDKNSFSCILTIQVRDSEKIKNHFPKQPSRAFMQQETYCTLNGGLKNIDRKNTTVLTTKLIFFAEQKHQKSINVK